MREKSQQLLKAYFDINNTFVKNTKIIFHDKQANEGKLKLFWNIIFYSIYRIIIPNIYLHTSVYFFKLLNLLNY